MRIFSDVHFGDRSSAVHALAQLRPLLQDVTHVVVNGDVVDTRPGPEPARTADLRAEVLDFFQRETPASTFITGNHDTDISDVHRLELARGQVCAIHGDILFENIVPWSRDAELIKAKIEQALAGIPPAQRENLDARLEIWRRVAGQIRQRQESERNRIKHTLKLMADTVWPPWRMLRVLRAWRHAPTRAADFARRYQPTAELIVIGHTHFPGIWRTPQRAVVVNTGSFCLPLGALVTEITDEEIRVRRVSRRAGEFRLGGVLARFPRRDG